MYKLINLFILPFLPLLVLAATGCDVIKFDKREAIEFRVMELKSNDSSVYYDAVVKVERLAISKIDANKGQFTVWTPAGNIEHEMKTLVFIEDGKSPQELEEGDIFVVPLRKPDWTLNISHKSTSTVDYIKVNFFHMLPEELQWDPLKSEAMAVARSIKLESDDAGLKPIPTFLPLEWVLMEDGADPSARNNKWSTYQKIRVGEVKEEVTIRYSKLSVKELTEVQDAGALSDEEFLKLRIWPGSGSYIRNYPKVTSVAGHRVVYNTFEGFADSQWIWRYAYLDGDIRIMVDVDTNPIESLKTEEEKQEERKTRAIFLTYSYLSNEDSEWKVKIDVRLNGEGNVNRTSVKMVKSGTFQLTPEELAQINETLNTNGFWDMAQQFPSPPPGSVRSCLTVIHDNIPNTVAVADEAVPGYQNIERKIKQILPK